MTNSHSSSAGKSSSKLRVGDWVEIRSKEEILRTLGSDGRLDGMPFMPEMFAFCGKKFQVYKRAHKTCDTVFPVRGRRVHQAVHLDTRCDGSGHGGCQASCLIFWKDAWLKPLGKGTGKEATALQSISQGRLGDTLSGNGCTERDVWDRVCCASAESKDITYTCQATQLPYATSDLEWWDVRQYVEDYVSGNVGLWRLICGATYFLYYWLTQLGIGLGRPLRWFYDTFHPLWAGSPFPRRSGTIPRGMSTPARPLNLQPGELVRIKPYKEVLTTLDTGNRNRGLYFDAEEVPYCEGTYRVQKRVTRIIDERTGRMREMKTPSFILDSVICQSRYSECRLFCPRSIFSYWREIWLERAEPRPTASPVEEEDSVAAP
jgi:hypothetical protein